MKSKFTIIISLAIAMLFIFTGCIEKEASTATTSGSTSTAGGGEVVAQVDSQKITVDQLNKKAMQWSMMGGEYYAQPEGRLEVLEEMINELLLNREISKKGLDREPQISQELSHYREQLDEQYNQYNIHLLNKSFD